MKIVAPILTVVIAIFLIGWLELHFKPQSFPAYLEKTPVLKTVGDLAIKGS